MEQYQAVEWLGNRVRILDQTLLPTEERYLELTEYEDVAEAIRSLRVRGAPAIGVAAAYGIALGALAIDTDNMPEFRDRLSTVIETIAATRPTARNLFMAAEQMQIAAESEGDVVSLKATLIEEATELHYAEVEATEKIAEYGAELISEGATILTHCNTGPLATTGMGTALGVIIRAHRDGKNIRVMNTETRPLLQGARLTAWELKKAGIPDTLITDSMAGHFMKADKIDCVIVGADRITANGDTANKIGTYTLAMLAKEHGIPFYIAAPSTTFDTSLKSGDEIVIEERKPEEITHIGTVRIAPKETVVSNPAFDVTPNRYITAFITENGVVHPPF